MIENKWYKILLCVFNSKSNILPGDYAPAKPNNHRNSGKFSTKFTRYSSKIVKNSDFQSAFGSQKT